MPLCVCVLGWRAQHLLQTAEAIRRDGHPRWFILTGLIHDLGKILCLWGEPQWAVVGDTNPGTPPRHTTHTAPHAPPDGPSPSSVYACVRGWMGGWAAVGCAFSDRIVYSEFFAENPDTRDAALSTPLGIYTPHCGLDEVHMTWGHDEYLYHVVKPYLPEPALYMIRYHRCIRCPHALHAHS
jgi:inositol oxygenase